MSKEIKKPKGNFEVTKSNELIEAKYKADPLTLQEQRIVLTLISMIEPGLTGPHSLKMNIKDYWELLEIKSEVNYTYIKKTARTLKSKQIEIRNGKREVLTNWVGDVYIDKGDGTIEFIIPNAIKPFLVNLNGSFTSVKLEKLLNLKSPYGMILYQLVVKSKNLHRKKFRYSLDELRGMLGATKKTYDQYGSLKKKILTPALDDIKETAKIDVTFAEIKEGKKVVALVFTINSTRSSTKKKVELENSEKLPLFNKDVAVNKFLKALEEK